MPRFLLAIVLAALPFLGTMPANAVPVAAQTPNTLVIDTTADPGSLDPALVAQTSGFSVINSIFDNLVERDYSGALVPMLAESWAFPDPTTVELKLRQGVTFQNGEPFNAASVKYSIDRLLDPTLNSPLRGGWPQTFQGVEVVDDATVRFHFSAPDATIFDTLAQSAAMLPPQYYASNSEDFLAANPIGTGPYRVVESVRDDHTTLAANPNYWGTSTYKGSPLVPTVIYRPVPDAATRVADLLNGTADMVFDVAPDDIDTLRGRSGDGFQIVTVWGSASRVQS
jgi:peptide/nickel transport system substrate-binding protein